jgi:hypothetical protein
VNFTEEKVDQVAASLGVQAEELKKPIILKPVKPITREALGQKLAGLAGKFGTSAQDGIKQIILETAGTQALSQVDVAHLPIINQKAEKFSEYLEAQARG